MMTWIKTKIAFFRTKRSLAPSRDFERALRLRLEQEMGGARQLHFWQLHRVASAAILSLVVCVGFSGTVAYAYTSPNVTPDHPLYEVRRGVEEVESLLAVTPSAKTRAQTNRLEHRVAEAEKVVAHEGQLKKVLNDIGNELSDTAKVSEEHADNERVLNSIERTDDRVFQKMQRLAEQHPEAAASVVNSVIVGDTRRLETALPKARNEKEKKFLRKRLDQRTKALETAIEKIEDRQKNVAPGTPKYEGLDRARLHLEDERNQALQVNIE